MALERKDVRFKIDPDAHSDLSVLADVDQLDIGEWVERVVSREIKRRVHDANVISQRTARPGRSGNRGEHGGKP